jgi:hypothetical protein
MTESYTDQLVAMETERDEAQWRAREAKEAARAAQSDRVRGVTSDLAEFHNAINFHKPEAVVPEKRAEREAELTATLLDSIREEGLTLVPVVGNGRPALVIHDPAVDEELNAALAKVNDLSRDIAHFVSIHGADLEAERSKAEADRIRETLEGDDPAAMRDALLGRDRTGVFTTEDLARPVVHKRSPVLR